MSSCPPPRRISGSCSGGRGRNSKPRTQTYAMPVTRISYHSPCAASRGARRIDDLELLEKNHRSLHGCGAGQARHPPGRDRGRRRIRRARVDRVRRRPPFHLQGRIATPRTRSRTHHRGPLPHLRLHLGHRRIRGPVRDHRGGRLHPDRGPEDHQPGHRQLSRGTAAGRRSTAR